MQATINIANPLGLVEPFIRELLTPEQQERLPSAIREMLRTPNFRHFFYSQNGLRLTCMHGSPNCP